MKEETIELALSAWFENLRIPSMSGAELHSGGLEGRGAVVLSTPLASAIRKLNLHLSDDAVANVLRTVLEPPHADLLENNRWFHTLLVDGVEVEYDDELTGVRVGRARLFDFERPDQNSFIAVRQLTVDSSSGAVVRPDVVFYVNGIPMVVFELKDPTDSGATLPRAVDQLQRYQTAAPELFVYNAMLVVSDAASTRVGTLTSGVSRFMPWRAGPGYPSTLESLVRALFTHENLAFYLRYCIVFQQDDRGAISKKVAGYHQLLAVKKALASVLARRKSSPADGDGRGGVIWHTQGSGKSLTMLMLAAALVGRAELENPTILVVTDRNDLDDQLFATFAAGRAMLRQQPVQADSRMNLATWLDRAAGGVMFTTIQKFEEGGEPLSQRANVVVLADEAHRSQYGFREGGARWMREALPNATFVGFTGTPLERDDRNTVNVFGDYIDVYDIRQAVEDGATRPLFYESHVVALTTDEQRLIEGERAIAAAAQDVRDGRGTPDRVRIPLSALVSAPDRLREVAAFMVEHWEKRRRAMEGKAMAVTMDRSIAVALYDQIVSLRPDWAASSDDGGAAKVVISGAASEGGIFSPHIRSREKLRRIAERFKDPYDELRLVVVCDMWLTGFDCPPAHTMYLDKPLAGHGLMQAIARVNRVYGEKPGGLIVDLLGLVDQFADALATYTNAGGRGSAVGDLEVEIVPRLFEAAEKLEALFYGFDVTAAVKADPARLVDYYLAAVDFVLGIEDGVRRLARLTKEFSALFALASPRPEALALADRLAFYQRVLAVIRKRLAEDEGGSEASAPSDVDAAVRQVVGGAVRAGEMIDLFQAAGLENARIDVLSTEFLQRLGSLGQKNLALATLRKVLSDKIRATEKENLVRGREFRDALESAMLAYTNRSITTAQVVLQLIELAEAIRDAQHRGEELGLREEELAFYDALTENGSVEGVMKSDQLRLLAQELAQTVRRMPKLDWRERESVRASLRRSVRRTLARFGYPPNLAEGATQLVVRQAELATDNSDGD